MSDELGRMIIKIADGIARKPNFSGYTWINDMKAERNISSFKISS